MIFGHNLGGRYFVSRLYITTYITVAKKLWPKNLPNMLFLTDRLFGGYDKIGEKESIIDNYTLKLS